MAKKKFRNSMSGYNKQDVNKYITDLMREYDEKLTEKDIQINSLNTDIENLKTDSDIIKKKEKELEQEKDNVTKALLKANEMSDRIVKEAKESAFKEVTDLEIRAEQQREKIIDLKKELASLSAQASKVLEKFSESLDKITGSSEQKD